MSVLGQKDRVVDADPEDQIEPQHVKELQRLSKQSKRRQGDHSCAYTGRQNAPRCATVAGKKHDPYREVTRDQHPAHSHAVAPKHGRDALDAVGPRNTHLLSSCLGLRTFVRYCDDILVFHDDPGRLREALCRIEDARSLTRAWMLILWHYAGAVEHLEQAVRLDPKFLGAYYLLGQAYLKVGEQKLSQEAFARFRELTDEERAARQTVRKKIVVQRPQ